MYVGAGLTAGYSPALRGGDLEVFPRTVLCLHSPGQATSSVFPQKTARVSRQGGIQYATLSLNDSQHLTLTACLKSAHLCLSSPRESESFPGNQVTW